MSAIEKREMNAIVFLTIVLFCSLIVNDGWSETTATNAPVQDEAVQAVLG
jgi:hypothetical protein